MDTTRRLWLGLAALMLAGFGVLLWMGWDIHLKAPPIPERVVSDRGDVIYTRADIEQGRRVWQSIGGQQLGSIWGHGALVAPDWSADWLHRESLALLEVWSQREHARPYAQLAPEQRGALEARLRAELRPNRVDPSSGTLTVSDERAEAMAGAIPGGSASKEDRSLRGRNRAWSPMPHTKLSNSSGARLTMAAKSWRASPKLHTASPMSRIAASRMSKRRFKFAR